MLTAAFALLSLAVLLGAGAGGRLAAGRRRGWRLGAVHGVSAGIGLLVAVAALPAAKLGPFAWDAVALLGSGLATGVWIALRAWHRRRPPGPLVLLHALAGGLGWLLLTGFVLG